MLAFTPQSAKFSEYYAGNPAGGTVLDNRKKEGKDDDRGNMRFDSCDKMCPDTVDAAKLVGGMQDILDMRMG